MAYYKLQGEIDFQGLKIKVENRKGSVRSGVDEDGHEWEIEMKSPYGYISGVNGTDGEGLDCFIGDNKESQKVFVIHIQNPETGEYEEDKVMLGFDSEQQARDMFLSHYDNYAFLQDITTMSMDEFKEKLKKRKGKMLKSVERIRRLFKGIKVKDLLTLDLFAQNQADEPKEGKTVIKNGRNYKYARSKKNPSVLRLFRDDQISLFGAGGKGSEDIKPSENVVKKQPEKGEENLFSQKQESQKPKEAGLKEVELKADEKADPIFNTVYGRNYRNLKKVIPNLDKIKIGDDFTLKSGGYMDLHIKVYGNDKYGRLILSLAHYGVQNGDLMSDPRMEIAIDSKNHTVEALSYENHYMGVYSEVYDNMYQQNKVNLREKKNQNDFLRTWINNLIEQGFKGDANEPKQQESAEPTKDNNVKDNGDTENSQSYDSRPQTEENESIEYQEVRGKKTRLNINEQVKKLLAEKEDHQFTKEDKQLLIQYTGRGGLADKNAEVDNVSLNEFYTLPKVTEFMWKAVHDLGFEGGRVLEPSSGTGNFLHTAPSNALVTGVEIDRTSGRIADILYGHRHDVRIESFEEFVAQSEGGEFDLVIGNPPFGDRGATIIYDSDKQDIEKHEQYFIDRGIDELKTDGILALIVPTGIMDNQLATWRLNINKKAEFLGAIRMPTGAFKHANAQVTTDIVFFRKRPQEIIERMNNLKGDELDKLYDAMILDHEFVGGTYFEKNPQYALGTKVDGLFGTKVWEGELNIDELDGMRALLKKEKDDYSQVFDDVELTPVSRTELHVGDIKNLNGRIYRLNENHRWERIMDEQLEEYTDMPEETKEKLGISNLAELHAIEVDIAKILELSRDQISYLGGSFAEKVKSELKYYEAKGDYRNEMLKKAVILGLAIRDFQIDLQNRKINTDESLLRASQIGILVKQFVELYGNPVTEAKLTSFLGITATNPILYLAGAIDLNGNLSKLLTDPVAFTNVYKDTKDIGSYDSESLYSIAQFLTNNNVPGTVEAIKGLYTGEESDIFKTLLTSEDIYIDENLNFAPLNEVCVGEVYNKLDAWRKRINDIDKELQNARGDDKELLTLEKDKLDKQIFELERRAEILSLDYLPVQLSDGGKLFDLKILNDYLELKLGASFADKVMYDKKLGLFTPETGVIKEAYLLYTQKGELEKDEKNRLKELLKLYFSNNDNPFFFAVINNLNGINTQWSRNDAERNRQEIQRIKSEFVTYLKGLDEADAIADRYNRLYNNYIQKQYSSSIIEGLSKFAYNRVIEKTKDGREITAKDKVGKHVWSTVRRFYEQGKGLIAHGVGLGKTLEAILLVMLHKETGRAKKPLIVTPKSVLKNWVNEIEKWTQGVNYIVVGMKKITESDGSVRWVEESREEKELKLLQVANNDYDMVLMSRDTFGTIDFSMETKNRMMRELVSKYYPDPSEQGGKKARARFERAMQNIAKMMAIKNGIQGVYFENLGFDMLVRDESHDVKNLLVPLKEEIKGVNSSQSQRAIHNLFVSKVIRSLNNELGIYSLTATPISNSPLEVFNILLPVAEKELEQLDAQNMDQFIRKFVDKEVAPVTDADGRVIMQERFGGWSQPEVLRKLFFRFTDYKTKDDVGLDIKFPKEKQNYVFSSLNERQKELMRHCQARLWTIRLKRLDKDGNWVLNEDGERGIEEYINDGFLTESDAAGIRNYFYNEYIPTYNKVNERLKEGGTPIDDSYFSIQSDMIKIASDLEWYAENSSVFSKKITAEEAAEDNDLEKIRQMRDNVIQIYKNGGKQLVFAINTKLHDRLFQQFVDAGIPANEIKIVNGKTVKDSIQRAQISDDFNEGKYKIIIGNYATMGEGLNFNNMTSDVHHLQPAWNHLQIEQGNGRAIRQGNNLDSVNTHYYLSKGSIDAFMNQKVHDKGDMVQKFMRGEINRWDSDVELSPEEMMIALAENPEVAKKLVEAQNIAIQNAIKEKERTSNYRKLSRFFDVRAQLNKLTNKDSRQYKQLEQELDRLPKEMPYEYRNVVSLEQRPIILPNHDAIIKVGSVIRFGSSDNSFAIVKNYTYSTGRVELETWDANHGMEERVLSLKDFEQQYGKTIESVDMDVYKMFDKLINEARVYAPGIISKLPLDVLKQNKVKILDNMKDHSVDVIYKDLDGNYKILDYKAARERAANEGGRIVFPQEDSGIAKYLYDQIRQYNYTAEYYALMIYGNNYKYKLTQIVKGEKAKEPTISIPTEGAQFYKKLDELAKKGFYFEDGVKDIKKLIKRTSDWNKGRAMSLYGELLRKEFLDDVFGSWNEANFVVPSKPLTDEQYERAKAIDNLWIKYAYQLDEQNTLENLLNKYNLIKKAS